MEETSREVEGEKRWQDSEAAYCHPPASMILQGLVDCNVAPGERLALEGILGRNIGALKLDNRLYGRWPITLGFTTGGALSQVCLEAMERPLYIELRAAGCGATINMLEGNEFKVVCQIIVDNVALPNDTTELRRTALRIVEEYSKSIQIRWNVVYEKSALMVWHRGGLSVQNRRRYFLLCGGRLHKLWHTYTVASCCSQHVLGSCI